MADPGREHQRIARPQSEECAVCAAQSQRDSAFGDPKRLMRVGMEVCVIVDRVGPNARPLGAIEALTKYLGFLRRVDWEYTAVQQDG
jgi:hypothetical protein